MKKKMIALIAGAMMSIAMAGSAMAAFTDQSLVQVIYDTTSSTEIATNLGTISSLVGTTNNTITANPFVLSDFGATASLANLRVGYFVTGTASVSGYAANAPSTTTYLAAGRLTNFQSLGNLVTTYYNSLGTTDKIVASQSFANSYVSAYDKPNVASYGSNITTTTFGFNYTTTGEASLATLAANSPVSMSLYQYTGAARAYSQGVQALTVALNADGTTTINAQSAPAATPIPAAAYLLGSGLLGMVGIRRKMNK
ncbi:hypothetical protein [Geobacter pickeringii]|uniref:Uncharacterized protein n=1 Tax=Geobacter pickeringii TaxID=345632 RepID=A0A0B5BDL8_9BACT|nr:hypothetical protein [Geobacter pickeringii]AJE03234.1 hypothetical protein GPICK_07580 [Geobacter pickeringii]